MTLLVRRRLAVVLALGALMLVAALAISAARDEPARTSAGPTTTLDDPPPSTTGPPTTPTDPAPDDRAPSGSRFAEVVVERFAERGIVAGDACDTTNAGVRRVFDEYGAVLVAEGVTPPTRCIFADEASTAAFQATLDQSTATIGGVAVTLQRPALEAFRAAVNEGASVGVAISPRGTLGSARSFTTSEELWRSRVDPGLDRYVGAGEISPERAEEIRAMDNLDQVATVLDLEAEGLLFGKNQAGPIMSSVAPPGASQHHSLVAQDVAQFGSPAVHDILARHGFFQTVVDDEPHFTYLGLDEAELPALGLRVIEAGPHRYWVPDV